MLDLRITGRFWMIVPDKKVRSSSPGRGKLQMLQMQQGVDLVVGVGVVVEIVLTTVRKGHAELGQMLRWS